MDAYDSDTALVLPSDIVRSLQRLGNGAVRNLQLGLLCSRIS